MTDWQPIETAPRDGTDILAWCADRAVVTFWGEVMARDDGTEGWILSYDGADPLWHSLPSHWLPIPPKPPTEEI